jgi:hypothetical protein
LTESIIASSEIVDASRAPFVLSVGWSGCVPVRGRLIGPRRRDAKPTTP